MNDDHMKEILDSIAHRGVPENLDLWTDISARIEKKTPVMILRPRPFVTILITLLILLVLSGTVYALGKLLGYIPGIGVVEQTSALRTLKDPVILEREGIRLTVVNVVASFTSTSVRFQVEWLTPPPATGDVDTSCRGTPALTLPDGTQLNFVQTTDKFTVDEPGSNAGYGYVMEFAPIPGNQSEVTFVYPCIIAIVPGSLPRDWQIPIHIISAPEGIVFPVVTMPITELTPTPLAEAITPSLPTLPPVDMTHRITMSVDSFVPTNDGYLLIGSMQWSPNDYPAHGVRPIPFTTHMSVIDSHEQAVPWQEVYENVKPQNEEYRSYWAIKVVNNTFVPPLRITMSAVDVQIQPVTFRFDVGAAPQAGQSWEVNQDIQIANSPVHIDKANLFSFEGNLNFQLDVQVDANMIGDLYINTPLNQCMGGGGGYPTEQLSTLQIYVPMCRPDIPPGMVEMQVTGAVLWGEWRVNWQP